MSASSYKSLQIVKKAEKDKLISSIVRIDERLSEIVEEIKPSFSEPIIINATNPDGLAKSLSKRYNYLRVNVCYENGNRSVYATPSYKKVGINLDKLNTESLRKMEGIMQNNLAMNFIMFPSHSLVCAYAQGYEDSCGDNECSGL